MSEHHATSAEIKSIGEDPDGPISENPYFYFEVRNMDDLLAYFNGGPSVGIDLVLRSQGFQGTPERVNALHEVLSMLAEQTG